MKTEHLTQDRIVTYSFCEPMIPNIGDFIEKHYIREGRSLDRLAVVFGGKRPALFLKRDLARRVNKAFHPPRFFAIDEFMNYTARKRDDFGANDDLDSCYLMYTLARQHVPHILRGRESFAQFLPWTREILAFIDQLDLEHVEDASLKNIEANAQIGYAVPDDVNRLLESIVRLREVYHQTLREQKIYSRGLQYRRAAQVVEDVNFEEFDQVLFCNFFYFNKSEEKVVKSLFERDKATLIFQGDARKWPVLQRIAGSFDHPLREGNQPDPTRFKLHLYAGFDLHSQVCQVREILKDIKNPDETVIVLPDPGHIVPLLSEISQAAQEFNISMGYPLKRSSLHTLFNFIFQAQLSKKEDRFYARDYLKAIRHPFIKNLKLGSDPAVTRVLIHKIEEILTGREITPLSGSLFIEPDDITNLEPLYMLTLEMLDRMEVDSSREQLQHILEHIHRLLFYHWNEVANFKSFTEALGHTLDVLVEKGSLTHYPLNINIATKMYAIKDELCNVAFHQEEFPKEEIFRIFDSKVESEIVAFHGQPLKGLQILGLFETRSLNFKNVIMLDVNEGSLPRLNIYEPLIPRDVMISLNLDRLELEEEIQRYQFMRLISSAQNVYLVYQQSKDKERSRFVEELIWNEQKSQEQLEVLPVQRAGFEVKVTPQHRVIEKTPEMIETLQNHSYSASSINMYLRNPMDFYYNYVLGLREHEDFLDEPEARHIGTFVHELLETVFMPFLKKKPRLDKNFYERFYQEFDRKFEEAFGRSMKSDALLLKSVLRERLDRFLDNETHSPDRRVEEILFLENRFEETIRLAGRDIRFAYVVDRIDRMHDGTVMIVDYKTGGVDQMPRSIERIGSMELSRESIYEQICSFQIPLYFHYLNRRFQDRPINAALYNLKTLKMNKFLNTRMSHSRDQIDKAFMRVLDFVMAEILDPNVPFIEGEEL